ncbi:MAG: hypothetical protein ACERKD_10110 [Prolixibacteraceae bacterium]
MATTVVGFWDSKKEKIKLKYTKLSDSDLNFENGKEKEMIEMLEYKLGLTKMELAKIIETI